PLNARTLGYMKRLSGADYLMVGASGTRVATFPADDLEQLPPAEAVVDDWETLSLGPPVQVAGKTYLCSGVRLRDPHEGETLYILYPEALYRDAVWPAVRAPLVLGGFASLASLALAVSVGQRLSRRIDELERRTRLIAAGDFSPMPLPRRNDELRDLACSVNDMAEKLAQLQEAVQRTERLRLLGQVSGGLAHQLRNGITGARLAVQLHASECAACARDVPPGKAPDPEALEVALRQ